MVIERPVYTEGNRNMLLPAGAVLSKSSIENLERLGFATLEIADRFTSFASLFEKMKESLKKTYGRYIDIYASEKEEENLCDDMVPAACIMKRIVNSICGRDNIINLCMQMHIQDSDLLFEHLVMTSVFFGTFGRLGCKGCSSCYNSRTDCICGTRTLLSVSHESI